MANFWTSAPMRRRHFEPYRQNFGYMLIYNLMGDAEDVALSIQTIALPNVSNEEIEIPFGNDRYWILGRRAVESISVTFVDFIQTRIVEILNWWQSRVYDPATGKMGYFSEYDRTADINQTDPKGDVMRTWKIESIFPQSVTYGTLDQSGTDKITVEVTFRVAGVRLEGR